MKLMRQTIAAGIAGLILCMSTNSIAGSVKLNEFYSVEIKHLMAKLDNVPHDLTVNLTWNFKINPDSSDYIDSNIMISEVKKFLTEYPNKSDFFEVVNHNLASHLIDKFKQLQGITVKISVPATKFDPFDHYTLVEATR